MEGLADDAPLAADSEEEYVVGADEAPALMHLDLADGHPARDVEHAAVKRDVGTCCPGTSTTSQCGPNPTNVDDLPCSAVDFWHEDLEVGVELVG